MCARSVPSLADTNDLHSGVPFREPHLVIIRIIAYNLNVATFMHHKCTDVSEASAIRSQEEW